MSAPGYTVGDTSITVGSTSNWSTDTGVTFAIDQAQVVNGVEVQIAGTYNEYVGTVASGTSVTNVSWVLGTGDRNYASGALTRVYIPVSANRENRIVTWGLSHANQDGTLKTTAVQAALNTNQVGSTDWTILANAPTLQSSNGQREYVIKYTGVDYTDRLQAGTKLKIPRTIAASTQSTSLNGTNQYWSKTSPAGMTFTDDFVVSAWVKLSSYPSVIAPIVARTNDVSGWELRVDSSGQIRLIGMNASNTNTSYVTTYQSIPLNKWVHITAQLDMSAFTASSTTSYIMLDGVDVPVSIGRTGTNPTSIIQAGNLEVGGRNGGSYVFSGKIAQATVSSSKLTQAQVRAFKDQKLTTALATTYSMAAAFPFDGNGNDVSTNANNLTANNGATATDTDTAFSTDVFGIATKVTLSGPDTLVTVFCPTGAGVPNETLGTTSYSTARAPYGFPASKSRWTVETVSKVVAQQTSPLANTAYNIGNLVIAVPTGDFTVVMKGTGEINRTGSSSGWARWCVNATPNALDADYADSIYHASNVASIQVLSGVSVTRPVTTTALSSYYVNAVTDIAGTNIGLRGDGAATRITAECAYL